MAGGAAFPYDPNRTITQATKYYVSPTGSDAAAGTIGAPFATLDHALTLSGPDVAILLMDGTHTWSSIETKFIGASGTAISPCLISSAPGHQPIIDCAADVAYGLSIEKSYWRVTHLALTNYTVGIRVAFNNTCTDIFLNNLLGTTTLGGDNKAMLSFTASRTPSITLSRIRAINTGTSLHQNTGCIYFTRTTDSVMTLESIECIGAPVGIHFKHGNPAPATQNATVTNVFLQGQTRWALGPNPSGVLFTNILCGSGAKVLLGAANGSPAGEGIALNTFEHCTFYEGVNLSDVGALNTTFTNSIGLGFDVDSPSTVAAASNYNLLTGILNYGVSQTLAQWQTSNSSDAASVGSNPTFVGTDFTTKAAYALSLGSAGKAAGTDGSDMGSDVTQVGIT